MTVRNRKQARRWAVMVGMCVGALAGFAAMQGTSAQQQPELVIHNGLIVNESGRMAADVRIVGEKIAEIGPHLTAGPGAREIDAAGMLLVPGAIDTHTHLNADSSVPPRPNSNTDDYVSGSSAALAGGITTVSNFLPMLPDETADAYAGRIKGQIHTSADRKSTRLN